MNLISKTINKIILEVTSREIQIDGFDKVWDKIRNVYPATDFQKEKIHTDKKNKIITIVLKKKTILSNID